MKALDSNVVLRFLVEDDPAQAATARHVVAETVRSGELLFLSDVVLVEVVWTLARAYRVARPQLIATLRSLVHAQHIVVADPIAVLRALDAFEKGKGDFSDYLIREHARKAGCDSVITFDKALHVEADFVAP